MADLEFYKLSMTGEEADSGIRTGMEAGATSGVLLGDGNGGVTAATPGRDFGYPLLEGNGPPTGNTAANIGQHYFDMQATQAPYEYICVGLNSNGFIWLVFGDAGNGFIISGYFASVDALNAAIAEGKVPVPTPGVNYAIGTEPPYDTVTWDGVANDWKNNGPLGASGGGSGVPPHGTTGQVLTKLSDRDGDAGWKDVVARAKVEAEAPAEPEEGDFWFDTTEGGPLSAAAEIFYPVGSIYMSVNSTNPAELFRFGTWVQIKDRFLLAAGDTYQAGATGGEATHTLTVEEMPSHKHFGASILSLNSAFSAINLSGSAAGSYYGYENAAGGDQPHNNMPPFLAVYVWQRTA